MNRFCHSMNTRTGRYLTIAVAIAAAVVAGDSDAASRDFQGIRVDVIGEGRPLLMIPGLNSAADTWRDTCDALQADRVQCHIVQLPGFAGQPPVSAEPWLASMRDRLLAYVNDAGLQQPSIIGHSLGGFLALQLSLAAPERFERLVLVDALPYFAAITNPAATVDSVRPMAEGMRARMLSADEASYRAQANMALNGMSNQPERMTTLLAWGEASDRATTAQAMYEMMTTDLRADVAAIRTPTLVLGAWAGYKAYGATPESVGQTFRQQYQALDDVRIELSDSGYHFLMWDDPRWLQSEVRGFLSSDPVAHH